MAALGRLETVVADADSIVGTGYHNGSFAVVVADRAALTRRAILPVIDREAYYSNGGLSAVDLLADGTVLVRVTVARGGGHFSLRLVVWDSATGSLFLVSRTSEDPGALTSIAIEALG